LPSAYSLRSCATSLTGSMPSTAAPAANISSP
jgi:hypothetical protein